MPDACYIKKKTKETKGSNFHECLGQILQIVAL